MQNEAKKNLESKADYLKDFLSRSEQNFKQLQSKILSLKGEISGFSQAIKKTKEFRQNLQSKVDSFLGKEEFPAEEIGKAKESLFVIDELGFYLDRSLSNLALSLSRYEGSFLNQKATIDQLKDDLGKFSKSLDDPNFGERPEKREILSVEERKKGEAK